MPGPGIQRTTATVAVLLISASACERLIGIEDTTQVSVRGLATGMIEPLELRLEYAGGSETLSVTRDGAFAFAASLAPGESFAVVPVGETSCVLDHASGIMTDMTAEFSLACEGVVMLDELAVSGPTAPDIDLAPDQLDYLVEVSVLQQRAVVSAVAAYADARIEVQDVALTSGMPGVPVALAPGDNHVNIDITHPSGLERTYRMNIRRAADMAQYAYGKASNAGKADHFGYSVAIFGDTLAVGAYMEDSAATGIDGNQSNNGMNDSGAVYVFRRTGAEWVQEAYIKASNTGTSDWFGASVALSGDTLAVGATGEDSAATGVAGDQADNSAADSGAVYIFQRHGAGWQQQAYIKASNTGAGDWFGFSVALEGDALAVGATGEDGPGTGLTGHQKSVATDSSGAVYVFRRAGETWQQTAYLKASNADAEDWFGIGMALHGNTLAVGASGEDSTATGVDGNQNDNSADNSGAVYVFEHAGHEWQQKAYIKASNTHAEDYFGASVAVEGDTLAVGAFGEDGAPSSYLGPRYRGQQTYTSPESGAVYIFRRAGASWQQTAYLKASNADAGDRFGYSVALRGDVLAIGAKYESSAATGINSDPTDNSANKSGAIYIFHHGGTWQQRVYVKASNTDDSDYFGAALALGDDALVAGAFAEASAATGINGFQDDNSAYASGAVYIFH